MCWLLALFILTQLVVEVDLFLSLACDHTKLNIMLLKFWEWKRNFHVNMLVKIDVSNVLDPVRLGATYDTAA